MGLVDIFGALYQYIGILSNFHIGYIHTFAA